MEPVTGAERADPSTIDGTKGALREALKGTLQGGLKGANGAQGCLEVRFWASRLLRVTCLGT